MTKKRSRSTSRPPSRRLDPVFKIGLSLLFLAALAVTFWPASKKHRTPEQPVAKSTAPEKAPSAPSPAPAAPPVSSPTGETAAKSAQETLDKRADAALIEKMLKSTVTADVGQFGNKLMAHGDFTNAVRMFRRTVELDGENEVNHYNLGLAYARLGQTNEAMAEFESALKIYPDFADAHNSLGLQLAAKGDLAGAEKQYRRAIKIQPDFALALNNLGTVLARKHDYEGARGWFEKAFKLDTNYVAAQFNLANTLLVTGHTNEAVGSIREILKQHPDYWPARELMSRLTSAGSGGTN